MIINETSGSNTSWEEGIKPELSFWENWFKTKGDRWPEDFEHRLNKNLVLDAWIETHFTGKSHIKILDVIIKMLDALKAYFLGKSHIKILDVGAGPLTVLGKIPQNKNKFLEIIPIDPLAEEYEKIMQKYDIQPVIKTKKGSVERLTEIFKKNEFDIVFMQNALDHSCDPLKGLMEMLTVCKKRGYIILIHSLREGLKEHYQGFHKWNLDIKDNDFIIWNEKGHCINVSQLLKDDCEINIKSNNKTDSLVVTLQKKNRS